MELLDLRYFVSIAETGSFTKSALQNNIAQSALSRRVRDIETELGVQLFYRNGRGVLLTEVGETFLARARGILEAAGFTQVVDAGGYSSLASRFPALAVK